MGSHGGYLNPAIVNLIAGATVGKPGFGYHVSAGPMILSFISMILALVAGGALVYIADDELKEHYVDYGEGLNAAVERLVGLLLAAPMIGLGFS